MLPIWGIIGAIAALSTEKTRKKAAAIRKERKLPIGTISAGICGPADSKDLWSCVSVGTAIALNNGLDVIMKQVPKIIEAKNVIGEATYKALAVIRERNDTPDVIKRMILLIENPSPEMPGIFMQKFASAFGKILPMIRGDLASAPGFTRPPSQTDFAQAVGVSRPVINGLEGQNYTPEYQTLVQIHHYLDLVASTNPEFKKKYDEKILGIINEAIDETEKEFDMAINQNQT